MLLSNSTNGTSLRLNGLKSKTVYMINISAVNTAGEGRQSASIAVETMPSLLGKLTSSQIKHYEQYIHTLCEWIKALCSEMLIF